NAVATIPFLELLAYSIDLLSAGSEAETRYIARVNVR
ncbi:hypothetical protein MGSAQ_000702, partial [marine sediment metagenome]